MANYLVTGYRGQAHVKASDDAALNKGICGELAKDKCQALKVGNCLSLTVDNLNKVTLNDGVLLFQGRMIRLETPISFDINSVSSGKYRFDTITLTYTMDAETGVENVDFELLEGEESTSPALPAITKASIDEGATKAQAHVWYISVSPTEIYKTEQRFTIVEDLESMGTKVNEIDTKIDEHDAAKITESGLAASQGYITPDTSQTNFLIKQRIKKGTNKNVYRIDIQYALKINGGGIRDGEHLYVAQVMTNLFYPNRNNIMLNAWLTTGGTNDGNINKGIRVMVLSNGNIRMYNNTGSLITPSNATLSFNGSWLVEV